MEQKYIEGKNKSGFLNKLSWLERLKSQNQVVSELWANIFQQNTKNNQNIRACQAQPAASLKAGNDLTKLPSDAL